jgi:protein-S-isoprenylcysteine O-methyltransferase Ste14
VISWLLLCISIIPLVFGIRDLRKLGKPAEKREGEPQLLAFEKTTALVTTGIYHYIRHPMYSSLLFLTWGLFFKVPGVWGILLTAISTISLLFTARMDEMECVRFFGSEYQQYMERTKRFIPYLF